MNCALCKYRTAALGFEEEVGLPQESHHHHVEEAGATALGSNIEDCTLCDDFCTGVCRLTDRAEHHHGQEHDHTHDYEHGHSHHPYPHAKYPHGPESVRKYMTRNGKETIK